MMMNVITFTCYKVENFRFICFVRASKQTELQIFKIHCPSVARLFRTISLGRLPTAADGIDDQNIVSLIVMLTKVELSKSFVKSLNHFRSKANLNLPLLSKRTDTTVQ